MVALPRAGCLCLVFAISVCGVRATGSATDPGQCLAGLRAGHPRLIADTGFAERLRTRRESDPQLAALLDTIVRDARRLLKEPPLGYHKTGRRLLAVSRAVEWRTLTLALAFRITGDGAFLKRAEEEMLSASAFGDWNPSHFLDVAEMTAALSLGYDWLYADLASDARAKIRNAIVDKGLRQALDSRASHNSWQHAENNWNQVCFGGLVLGALAVGDEEPAIAGDILERARAGIGNGLRAYVPDGVYPEGPGYWSFGTSYSVLMIAGLESALGTDWGVSQSSGFLASAEAFLQMTSPTGRFFNFSDCREGATLEPALFWFARKLGRPELLRQQRAVLARLAGKSGNDAAAGEGGRMLPLAAVWWPEPAASPKGDSPLRWMGRGPNPIAVFRSAWGDPDAFYLALKGGSAGLSHAHMDAGSFVLECDGVRWARDLGMQEYESLESKGIDLWNRRQDSQRWQVFRLNNRSHNTLTIDGKLHSVAGGARIEAFEDDPRNPLAIVSMAEIFRGQAGSVRRGFRVVRGSEVLIQDELTGLRPGADVRWVMVTGAAVVVSGDGARAELTERGRTFEMRLLQPSGSMFDVIDAAPPADGFNAANPDRRMLIFHAMAPESGVLTLAVWLNSARLPGADAPQVRPLAEWLVGK